MRGSEELSAQARELIELTFDGSHPREGVVLSKVLIEHPQLMQGLDEYIKWRDEQLRMVAKTDTVQPVGHSVSGVLVKILTPPTKPTSK